MKKGLPIFLLLFLLNVGLMAQDLKYERKSISYASILLVLDPSIKIEQSEREYLIKKLREYIEMPRFDYNPIPVELLEDFNMEVKSRGSSVSIDEVVDILKSKFVPKIIEILDIEKEIRAQNLLTEEQRNSFIATKAKALGITAEQAMKIMNSAFIYIPVISKYNVYVDNLTMVNTVELYAGAIWYRVIYKENGEGDLKLVVRKETKGIGVAGIGKEYKHEGEKVDYKKYAFRTAAIALARDIQVATKDIPEFRLGAQVVEVYSNAVSFPMGKKEGIKIDDGFDLIELQEGLGGEIVQKKIGFSRVVKVADNRTNPRNFSKAQIIIGNGIEAGIYVSERPRLPIDLTVKLTNNPFTVESDEMTGYSIHAELLYNLGRNVDIPQVWVGAGIFLGTGDAENLQVMKARFDGKPDVGILGFNGILMKKFYYKRFAGIGRTELIFEKITFSKGENELSHSQLGLGIGIGIEYVATPDLNLGFNLGYRFFSESEEWSTGSLQGTFYGLVGNHSGTFYSFYLSYSLPKLGFDPIAAIKGALSW